MSKAYMPVSPTPLTIRLMVPTDRERQQTYSRVISRPPEVVNRADSPALIEFYRLLERTFEPGELEPLERFQNEIASNAQGSSDAHYLCILLREPEAEGGIACGAYASVQDGVLAGRFVVTNEPYRATGISQEVIRLLMVEALQWSVSQGQAIWAWFGECVDASEAFFNRALGRRRLYATLGERLLREIHYELPHLGVWGSDGNPIDLQREPTREHLQLAAAGCTDQMPLAILEKVLSTVWTEWYVHSDREFDGRQAWERHRRIVLEETLVGRVLGPLSGCQNLTLLSREERERRRHEGWTIEDLTT